MPHAPFTLAQASGIGQLTPDLPELPPSNLLTQYTLEEPLVPVVMLIVAGLIGLLILHRTGKGRAGLITAAVSVGLAGTLIGLDALIETASERVRSVSADFILAAGTKDSRGAEALMTDDASLIGVRGYGGLDREGMLNAVEAGFFPYGPFTDVRVREVRVGLERPEVARALVRVEAESSSGFQAAWVELRWLRDNTDDAPWRLYELRPRWLRGFGNM